MRADDDQIGPQFLCRGKDSLVDRAVAHFALCLVAKTGGNLFELFADFFAALVKNAGRHFGSQIERQILDDSHQSDFRIRSGDILCHLQSFSCFSRMADIDRHQDRFVHR